MYAIGDAAAITMPWGVPRMSCQAGLPTGLYVADAIAVQLSGHTPRTYQFRFWDLCISLGRRRGIMQMVRPSDRSTELLFSGRPGAALKDMICRSAVWGASRGNASARMLYPFARAARTPVATSGNIADLCA